MRIATSVLFAVMMAGIASCTPQASDEEIAQMCNRLLELRDKEGDETMKKSCVSEAKTQDVSKRQALCRISAVNQQEYWNRCRTGEARSR